MTDLPNDSGKLMHFGKKTFSSSSLGRSKNIPNLPTLMFKSLCLLVIKAPVRVSDGLVEGSGGEFTVYP